ncbi:MAG: microcin C ABC transporter permease YejB [Saccharospirillaceae bacterium]|nr:microcin C ABC transporter permease YejB [Pseudomonadales bacterium]NRB79773.1 microcin C ABC transporter permease YejB [Saccharospirillaceae bacterium]
MLTYLIRRLMLVIPTFMVIISINFFIIQIAPGGPVDQYIAQQEGIGDVNLMKDRLTGDNVNEVIDTQQDKKSGYQGAGGLTKEELLLIKQRFGFDKPIMVRFGIMLKDYMTFNFGDSLFRGSSVIELIVDRLPVSITLGLWSMLIVYLISIPLGIKKALRNNSKMDYYSTLVLLVTSSIPSFILAILLIVLFAGGSYWDWFPLRGLVSSDFDSLSFIAKISDYFWHITLPVIAMVLTSFAGLTLLTKNLFLEEISKQYVLTARAKGLTESGILYKHIFRNAMLLITSGLPAAVIGIFFGSSLIIEIIFSLDGLGLLFYETTIQRDYPVMFSTLFVFTLLGLLMGIISDFMYVLIDPRIDFEAI